MMKYQEKICQLILKEIQQQPKNILDIGCGNGIYLDIFYKITEATGYGIDLNRNYIDQGKKLFSNPQIKLEMMDGCALEKSVTEQTYDLILLIGSRVLDLGIYSAEQIQNNLKNYYQLLNVGGHIAIFENTNLTGEIEPRAGWQFKTIEQIKMLQPDDSKTLYLKFRNGKFLFSLPSFTPKLLEKIATVTGDRFHPTFSYLILIQKDSSTSLN